MNFKKNQVLGCVKIRDVIQNEIWFNYQKNLKLNLISNLKMMIQIKNSHFSLILNVKNEFSLELNFKVKITRNHTKRAIVWSTKDGSTEALLQILYGQYLILGAFGSCMF